MFNTVMQYDLCRVFYHKEKNKMFSQLVIVTFDFLVRCNSGVELLKPTADGSDTLLKLLWQHADAIICCSLKVCTVHAFPPFISFS